jgi:glycosyltransferase involved in cell wall biosynthesis
VSQQASLSPRPLVSVVIPSHNRAAYVGDAIKSVLNQTYRDVEVAVVDDGSTDSTSAIIAALAATDSRIRSLRLSVNQGAQAARNAGIGSSTGAWVTFLDSDDRYLPHSIEARLDAAINCGKRVVHSDAMRLGTDGSRLPYGIPPLEGNVRKQLLRAPGTLFPSLLVHRRVLEAIGPLDDSITAWQEWETSIRLSEIEEFAFVREPTFEYDERTPGAISRSSLRAADGYEQIIRKHRRVILREVGARALANHYRMIVETRVAGGDRIGAIPSALVASLLWPPHGLRAARSIARATRPVAA